MTSMPQVYKHKPTGTYYVPVKGRSTREIPGFGPMDETVVQRYVYPLFDGGPVWLPEMELELVPDLRGRRFRTRSPLTFWLGVGLVILLGLPVQWYLFRHGVTLWVATPVAMLAASCVVDRILVRPSR
jgi:hypothetical protein